MLAATSNPLSRGAFWAGGFICALPLFSLSPAVASFVAPAALLAGLALALTLGNPYAAVTKGFTKGLLQASVVLLGFSMDFRNIAQTGGSGILFSLLSISSIFALGWVLQRFFKIRQVTGLLVSAGTAICGGSAIAAVSSVVDAPEEDVTVAIGTVFLLNALALLVFPWAGHELGLSQHQFGVWSGMAIHDIASVVGAGGAYGAESLDVATAVKLSRVIYLVPITFIAALFCRCGAPGSSKKVQIPWFVGLFLVASLLRGVIPAVADHSGEIKRLASCGFATSLFLIGAALTPGTLKQVGIRPLALGATLWVFISVASLAAIRWAS